MESKPRLYITPGELTQDDLNRAQLEIAYRNAGQIKYAANVVGFVAMVYLAYATFCAIQYYIYGSPC